MNFKVQLPTRYALEYNLQQFLLHYGIGFLQFFIFIIIVCIAGLSCKGRHQRSAILNCADERLARRRRRAKIVIGDTFETD